MKLLHYVNGYKYTHMTNSCYKFSGSAVEAQYLSPHIMYI